MANEIVFIEPNLHCVMDILSQCKTTPSITIGDGCARVVWDTKVRYLEIVVCNGKVIEWWYSTTRSAKKHFGSKMSKKLMGFVAKI